MPSTVTLGDGSARSFFALTAAADQQHNGEDDENHQRSRHAQ